MRFQEIAEHNLKSRHILSESWQSLTEAQRLYLGRWERELWPLVEQYVKLCEATLTPDQIQQIFQNAETVAAQGNNRTGLGKATDKAVAAGKMSAELAKQVNDKINELGRMAQEAGPIKNADQKFEQLKKDIKEKNSDSKVIQGIEKVSDWAKENPGKSSLAIGILTTIAALAGGPAGGAAAGLILRSSNQLLQGAKLSTAAGKSIKTAAIGALAGMAFDAIGDSVVDNIADADAQDLEKMVQGFDEANLESAMAEISPEYAGLLDDLDGARRLRLDGNVNRFSYNYDVILTTEQYQEYNQLNDSLRQAMSQHGSFSEEAMVKTAEFHNFMAGAQNDPIQGQYRQAIAAVKAAESQATHLSLDQLDQLVAGIDNLEAKIDAMTSADKAIASAVQGATQEYANAKDNAVKASSPTQGSENKQQSQESVYRQQRPLSERQAYLLFNRVEQLKEGPGLDKLKSQGKQAVDAAKAKASEIGKNLTNKVTASKLMKQWKAMKEPSDTGSIIKILQDAGLGTEQIAQVGQASDIDLGASGGETASSAQQPTAQDTASSGTADSTVNLKPIADKIIQSGPKVIQAVKDMISAELKASPSSDPAKAQAASSDSGAAQVADGKQAASSDSGAAQAADGKQAASSDSGAAQAADSGSGATGSSTSSDNSSSAETRPSTQMDTGLKQLHAQVLKGDVQAAKDLVQSLSDINQMVKRHANAANKSIGRGVQDQGEREKLVKQVRTIATESYNHLTRVFDYANITWQQVGYQPLISEQASDTVTLKPINNNKPKRTR